MEPNSTLLLALTLLAAVAALAGVILLRQLGTKIGCGLLAMLLSVTAGMAVVNDYYGYYQTWSQLSADLTGSYSSFADSASLSRASGPRLHGQLRSLSLLGARSGITRDGFVYLPPQYFQRQYAHIRFPVVELIHGSPGNQLAWVVHLRVVLVMDHLLAAHEIGPMILVVPAMNAGRHYEECLNVPRGPQDDTYISDDVRTDVLSAFRASPDPSQWGISGFSSGGYCAVNLALRHPAQFGASAALSGYFRPTDGEAAGVLHDNAVDEAANDPLLRAEQLRTGAHPLPAFWLSAGTGDASDWAAALAFVKALHGVEQVQLYREPGASHNVYAWQPAVPTMLSWMWAQLAPPDLRVQFPIAGKAQASTIKPIIPTVHTNIPTAHTKQGHHHRRVSRSS